MTEKEAIETLQGKSLECCEAFGFDCGNCDKCEVTIAYDMAIKALEKQIPKKPVTEKDKVTFGIVCGRCPECDSAVYSTTNLYCHKCGQALDWSEKE